MRVSVKIKKFQPPGIPVYLPSEFNSDDNVTMEFQRYFEAKRRVILRKYHFAELVVFNNLMGI